MTRFLRLFSFIAATLIVVSFPALGQSNDKKAEGYTKNQAEFYLSGKQLSYIRPGLNVSIEDVTAQAGQAPVVEFRLYDDLGRPLDRAGLVTPGSISVSFILSAWDPETRNYSAHTTRTATGQDGTVAVQASTDRGGSFEDLDIGHYRYTFATALPANTSATQTQTLAIYSTRATEDIVGKDYEFNVEYDFRLDGGTVTETWDAFSNETCNSCHHDLALHGGHRKDIKLCVTCHNQGVIDPDSGNTVDMKVMIHKIHMGANLPSVQAGTPYQIIGFRNSVHDYSNVHLPQDIRNCETCHKPTQTEGFIWYANPNRDACGSCHDNINWVTGEGHTPGPQADDSACANCHIPEGEAEFDVSVIGAHTIPTKSEELPGLNAEILAVEGNVPGGNLTVTYRITNDDGTVVDPSTLDRLNFRVAGPTDDYSFNFGEDGRGAAFDGDTAVYTFETPLPEDADRTWAISADIYKFVDVAAGTENEVRVRDAAFNPYMTFAVTDASPVERREIVELDKCNSCHETLALHGGQRFRIEECVMCHMPESDDSAVRPEDDGPAQSIHFKFMIHRIHRGHELATDFTVYGFRSSVHNYNEVHYPGDLRNCEACHVEGSYNVPLPEEALPTNTPRDIFSPMQPGTAACISCHDGEDAVAHAFVNTAPFGEACASCHGPNREFAVERVHAD